MLDFLAISAIVTLLIIALPKGVLSILNFLTCLKDKLIQPEK